MQTIEGRRIAVRLSDVTRDGPFEIKAFDVFVRGLPAGFEGYRLAHLSDLHLGPLTGEDHVRRALAIARTGHPDMALVTGDLIQAGRGPLGHFLGTKVDPKRFGWWDYRRGVRRYADRLRELLAELRPPDGLIGVLGNHDYLEGVGTILRRLGGSVRFLRNESVLVSRGGDAMQIAGIDDFREGDPCIRTAIDSLAHERSAESSKTFMRILMSHNPDVVLHEDAHLIEDFDLVLCGHTHGGQVRVPFIGPLMTSTEQKEHVMGLSRHGYTPFFVTSGVGYGLMSLRMMCPPEIVFFNLKASK